MHPHASHSQIVLSSRGYANDHWVFTREEQKDPAVKENRSNTGLIPYSGPSERKSFGRFFYNYTHTQRLLSTGVESNTALEDNTSTTGNDLLDTSRLSVPQSKRPDKRISMVGDVSSHS